MGDLPTMATSLAKFSGADINTVSQLLSGDERETTLRSIEKIIAVLTTSEESAKQQGPTEKSKEEKFTAYVLPMIMRGLHEHEKELPGSVKCPGKIEYFDKSMNKMRIISKTLDAQEKYAGSLNAYFKGKLYTFSCDKYGSKYNDNTFYKTNFKISYQKARQYIDFFAIVQMFPRLITVGVCYTQIVEYSSMLQEHLQKDQNLYDRLAKDLEVVAANGNIRIVPTNVPRDAADEGETAMDTEP